MIRVPGIIKFTLRGVYQKGYPGIIDPSHVSDELWIDKRDWGGGYQLRFNYEGYHENVPTWFGYKSNYKPETIYVYNTYDNARQDKVKILESQSQLDDIARYLREVVPGNKNEK